MKNFIIAPLASLFSFAILAADIEVIPPPGGGFSIQSSQGDPAFRVEAETGKIYIKNLPEEYGNTPLCWNSGSKLLSPCTGSSSAGGGDMVPPTISTNAPETATSGRVSFSVDCTDDIELFKCGTDEKIVGPGLKNATFDEVINIRLGDQYKKIYFAADNSGNVTKLPVTINTPSTYIPLGTYNIISPRLLPEDFDCREPYPTWSNTGEKILADVFFMDHVNFSPNWDMEHGYTPIVQVNFEYESGRSGFSLVLSDLEENEIPDCIECLGYDDDRPKVPLSADTINLNKSINSRESGPGYQIATGYSGDVSYETSTKILTLNVKMICHTKTNFDDPYNMTTGSPLQIKATFAD